MTKKLEIIIEGQTEGRLEVDEIGKEEIKVVGFELKQEIRERLKMNLLKPGTLYLDTYSNYIKTVQHGMEHYLEKKVEIKEYVQN